MFWLMDPGTVIGTRDSVPEPTSAMTWRANKGLLGVVTGRTWPDPGLSHKARNTREDVLLRIWQDCVADRFGRREAVPPNALAPPKSVFSYAMTVMDRKDGTRKNGWVRDVRRACGSAQKPYCVMVRGPRKLWFSSPSRVNQTFTNNGTQIAKYHEAVATVTMPFEGLHTPRMCLLRSVSVVLYTSPDKDWNVEEEMKGWGLGEWPCLPSYDNDWNDDISDA